MAHISLTLPARDVFIFYQNHLVLDTVWFYLYIILNQVELSLILGIDRKILLSQFYLKIAVSKIYFAIYE